MVNVVFVVVVVIVVLAGVVVLLEVVIVVAVVVLLLLPLRFPLSNPSLPYQLPSLWQCRAGPAKLLSRRQELNCNLINNLTGSAFAKAGKATHTQRQYQ